ncbi:hypothetical protein [Lactobacillus johnsonii]|uniref:hypothetical protein n=1 Tax=uncultured Lactobacillus sp. TaxID=153152 RepID=UPI002FDAB036
MTRWYKVLRSQRRRDQVVSNIIEKNYGHYLILEGVISRFDNQIKWLKTIKQR